ncbi:TlpA disulfide reductase family protein [Fulvivirgaceae bacterium BMA10]|uniref:TlpA disulfide reductase family protein n=1 Tax=Splendidivirga corallicola TaxID=3051826 RepID=A0ABT8KIA4_9BACT|nr:TlpA disulfide reductase family protein [Fulvivirgaceae bacterium BMA10]
MKNINFLLLFSFMALACNQAGQQELDGIKISGKVNNPQEGLIVLEMLKDNAMVTLDTIELNEDQTFLATVEVASPNFYRLNFYNQQIVPFILNNEDVEIVVDGNVRNGFAEVKGSTDTDYFNQINDIMQDFQVATQKLNARFGEAQRANDQALAVQLREEYTASEQANKEKIKEAINGMGNSIVAIIATNYLDKDADFAFMDQLAQKFEKELPNSQFTKELSSKVNSLRKLAIGQVAPDITLENPQGEMVSLSSLRGKYVMIDFWAAWCRPCRMENPNVVKMYKKYNAKGFEVFGVSLDRKKEDWVKAIDQDGLNWTHVSDLKYFNSEAAKLYDIQAIPATYLIDKEGKIIAKNLRGKALEDKLAEIFG